jgi:hypothetical protein
MGLRAAMEWALWISITANLICPLAFFFARNWLKAHIEKSVQHGFDVKIENLRSELRKSEESFKKDLLEKEAEISTLRNAAIERHSTRQAALDKRRLEAVERVWAALVALAPLYSVAAMMSRIDIKQAAKSVVREENARKMFEMISNNAQITQLSKTSTGNERPFVSELAWAYFSAYQTAVIISYTTAKTLATGVEDVDKLIKFDHVNKMLQSALPHRSKYIDDHGFNSYYYLLEELESNLLSALKISLEGADLDQESVARSAEIIRMSKNAMDNSGTEAVDNM